MRTTTNHNSQTSHSVKLHKVKKNWVAIGATTLTAVAGVSLMSESTVAADSWVPNSVDSIAARIQEGDTSITMQAGDTVWNIAQALNIANPMSLLSENGYKDGEQYDLAIGTVISWNGNKVTVKDQAGKVISEATITPDEKVDPSKPVANQTSDEVAAPTVTTQAPVAQTAPAAPAVSSQTPAKPATTETPAAPATSTTVETPATTVVTEPATTTPVVSEPVTTAPVTTAPVVTEPAVDVNSDANVIAARAALEAAQAAEAQELAKLDEINVTFSSLADSIQSASAKVDELKFKISDLTSQIDATTDEAVRSELFDKKSAAEFELVEAESAFASLQATFTPVMNTRNEILASVAQLTNARIAAEAAVAAAIEAASVVETPVTEAPVIETPVVETPVTETPVVETPVVETPVVETPVVETPVTEPVVETPVTEPAVETPVTEPAVETPVTETPVVETPAVEGPVTEAPVTEPVVEAPVTETPVVEAPVTEPVVEAPVTETPAVEAPVTEAPVTEPVVETPVAEEPVVETPVAEEPVVETPATENVFFAEALNKAFLEFRQSQGLRELTYSTSIQEFADSRARQLTEEFAHSYKGQSASNMLKEELKSQGLKMTFFGSRENVGGTYFAETPEDAAKQIVEAWSNSRGHRKNMVNSLDLYAVSMIKVGEFAYYGVLISHTQR